MVDAVKIIPPIEKMIREIGSDRSLRIEQWRDQWGHWRVGVDWFSEEDCAFVCEKKELSHALFEAYEYYKNPKEYKK